MVSNVFIVISKYLSLLVGVGLIMINIVGLFINYPSIPERNALGPDMRTITIKSEDLDMLSHETERDYMVRVSHLIDGHIVHFWAPFSEYSKIDIFDNYLLYILSYFERFKKFRNYEFARDDLALKRGYGYCSQTSRVAYSAFKRNGIVTRIYANKYHVLVVAYDNNGNEYIVDPTYGIVIPFPLQELYENINLIKKYYSGTDGKMNVNLLSAYKIGFKEYFSESYYEDRKNLEDFFYFFKWAIPAILLILSFVTCIICKQK